MIVNNGRILGNGGRIFRAQIVQSFVQLDSPYNNNVLFTLSGVTGANPFHLYHETPTGLTIYTYTTDGSYNVFFGATGEYSFKEFYFAGDVTSLRSLEFYNQYVGYGFAYKGDLRRLLDQFPNLRSLKMNQTNNTSYNYSQFNQDMGGTTFPQNIDIFRIADGTITGDINTMTNLDKVSDLELVQPQFTGNLDSGFTNVIRLSLDYLNYLNGNINTIFTNNPNLNHLNLTQCPLMVCSATTLDVQRLNYLYLYLISMPNVTGNISGWTFNTGLTTLSIYNNPYVEGDLTNWNIGNTKLNYFFIYDNQSSFPLNTKFTGSLSGWTLPSTLTDFSLYFSSGITSVPISFSGCSNLTSITFYSMISANQDINDFKFNNHLQNLSIYNFYGKAKLYGNLNTVMLPTSLASFYIQNSKITGDIALIIFSGSTNLQQVDLSQNYLTGNVVDMFIPNTMNYFIVGGNTGMTANFSNTPFVSGNTVGVFHTKNLTQLNFSNLSGITGNLSNFIVDNPFGQLYINSNSNFNCDLSKLDLTKVQFFNAVQCPNLYGDLTNWLTGTTALYELDLSNDSMLSGDTTGWNVNGISSMRIEYTNLSGKLKLNNVNWLIANNTKISSNIETDFNFSNQGYYVDLHNCGYVTGNLSGVTLGHLQYQFVLANCTGITGSNSFINYLFINRKNFGQNALYVDLQNTGEAVTGGTKMLGDTGTFPIGTGGTDQWNLTESQVNFLVAGLDYTGTGTSIPWTNGQKAYWMENAAISSINYNRRYIYYQIYY
jgi:hypothetical protein